VGDVLRWWIMAHVPASVRRVRAALALLIGMGLPCLPTLVCAQSSTPNTPAKTEAGPPQPSPASRAAPPKVTFEIQAYDVDGNTLLDQEAIESAVYPFTGPDRTRDDVASARDALQKAYQGKGYQSVVVEVPAQDARTGVIRLHVVEAPVGRLRVVDSRYFSLDRIKEQVPSLKEGQVPNFNEAQKEVAEVNRLPERRVTPLIKPGKIPGTVDVDLKVSDTLPLHASFEINNDHSANTTPLRTAATVTYSDLWQLGHSFSATALLAPENTNEALVFSGSYLAPIWGTPWSVLLYGYTSNSTVATLGGTNVLGDGYAVGTRGLLQLPQFGDFAESLGFGIDFKHFLETLSLGKTSTQAIVEYWPAVVNYTLQFADGGSSASASATLTLGVRGLGSSTAEFQNKRFSARSDFVHLNLDFNALQEIPGGFQVAGRLSTQLADQPLVSSEQFSVGGLTSVRGYLQSEALGDDGILGSIEVRTPSVTPLLGSAMESYFDDWRLFVFADDAETWVLDALPGQQSQFRLKSVGIGTRFHALSHVTGDVDFAFPLLTGPNTRGKQPYVQFSLKSEL